MKEIWKPAIGYDGKPVESPQGTRYEVSSAGRVRSLRPDGKTRILRQGLCRSGTYQVGMYDGFGRFKLLTHQAVMFAFEGLPADGMVVVHINGDRKDNRRENLRYVHRDTVRRNARCVALLQTPGGHECMQIYPSALAADVALSLAKGTASRSACRGRPVRGYLFRYV